MNQKDEDPQGRGRQEGHEVVPHREGEDEDHEQQDDGPGAKTPVWIGTGSVAHCECIFMMTNITTASAIITQPRYVIAGLVYRCRLTVQPLFWAI